VSAGVQVGEIQLDQGWVLKVAWSPTTPGVFASACYGDGRSDSMRLFLPGGSHFYSSSNYAARRGFGQ
jgi:hypothetical protein